MRCKLHVEPFRLFSVHYFTCEILLVTYAYPQRQGHNITDGKNLFLTVFRPKTALKESFKLIYKFYEAGAKHVQYAVHFSLQQIEIEKQHAPQLIAVFLASCSECVAECVSLIQLSLQLEHRIHYTSFKQPYRQKSHRLRSNERALQVVGK